MLEAAPARVETPPGFQFNSHNIAADVPTALPQAARMLTLPEIEAGVPVFPLADFVTLKTEDWSVWLDTDDFLDPGAFDPNVALGEERVGVLRLEHTGVDGVARSHFIVDLSPVHVVHGVEVPTVRRVPDKETDDGVNSMLDTMIAFIMKDTVQASGVIVGREDGPRDYVGSELFDEPARALGVVVFAKMLRERAGEADTEPEQDPDALLREAVTALVNDRVRKPQPAKQAQKGFRPKSSRRRRGGR